MLALLSAFFSWLACRLRSRAELEFEVMVLRHQLAVLHRQHPGRPRVCSIDRLLWVWLYRVWPRCLYTIVLVKPATVVQWHRRGFRLYWRWRSHPGRRPVDGQTRKLIREMCIANPLWGNEANGIAAIDMFIVPSAAFRLLFVVLILAHDRRRIVHFDVTEHPTAGWLSRQVTEAFPWDTAPRFLLRDRDANKGLLASRLMLETSDAY
jgi:putative transposase